MGGVDYWLITLSMIDSESVQDPFNDLKQVLSGPRKREYKVFYVTKATGALKKMTVREFATN